MRLATLRTSQGPRAALLQNDYFVDLQATDPALPSGVRQLLEGGPSLLDAVREAAASPKAVRIPLKGASFLAPIPDPHKIVCIGQNYLDHIQETGAPIPKEPVLFSKYATALTGHNCPIELPKVSSAVDYEAELVIVIGKPGRHIAPAAAHDHVAAYTIGHDVSARDWQRKDGQQWMIGKTFDTFAPTGPWIITRDEVPEPHNLRIAARLNGQTMQDSRTSQMLFRVEQILPYISTVFTLEVGDLIFTGTPPGVGMARKPPVFLKPGDVVEIEIEGFGVLRNPVVQGA